MENGRVHTSINAGIEISIVITYRDEDTSYYDKEDQCYYFENYITAQEKHWIDIPLTIEFEIENDSDNYIISDFKVVTNKYNLYDTLDLDDDTMLYFKEIKSTQTDNDIVCCSECGEIIGPSHKVSYYDYDDMPLCSNCMIGDSKNDICPHCGKKVPREHMNGSYCDICSKDIDD